ncbi:hypothetical protein C2G38_2148081 [Gigaspora rosea]|uniref:Uncharacterized protein n=1 Tax=Gigaspora rosea TaxID=44941 RepID=A0A397UB89_9GLOM|nr:hypothetical protein C2G38_2148081 [Gigaspora rosea]
MTSSSYVEIPIEEALDKNKEILEIVCSPNLKYIAVLDNDNNISFWSEEPLTNVNTIHIENINTKKKGKRIFAISDKKHASIGLNGVDHYNFKIFNFETGKEVSLTFPDWRKKIDILSFTDKGNIVMVNVKYRRAYVFTSKDNVSWGCKSMIELKYFKQIYITLKGKLIIFNDTIYEITMWDVEDLSVKTRILIDWNYIPESIKISDDEEILLVCTKNEETKATRFYSFSTETGMNLAFFDTQLVIDRFYLIASRKAERLLYIGTYEQDKQYSIMDPYSLTFPIDAEELFENIEENKIQEPYIIQSDKIIYFIDGKLSIKELVPDNSNDWVKYLRKKLRDDNSITAPSKKTIDYITKITNNQNYNTEKKYFEGKFLKWELESDDKSLRLTVVNYNFRRKKWNDQRKKQLDILPLSIDSEEEKDSEEEENEKKGSKEKEKNPEKIELLNMNIEGFIVHCELLENDDFFTITRIGVIIWTYRSFEIKMHYYWNDCNESLVDFDFEKSKFKNLFKYWTPGRILPASSYETICKNLNIKFGEKKLFDEFLEDNIKEEFYLTCYGKDLMKTLIKQKDDKWIRFLRNSCMNKFVQETNPLLSKISLLRIIFDRFNELSEIHPTFIASTLSLIEFVVPSNIVNLDSTSLHLSSYGRYCHLSETSYLDIFIPNLWNPFISFFQKWQKYFNQDSHNSNHSSIVLAIPLPNFVSYPKEYENIWLEFWHPKPNCFTHLPNNQFKDELYKNINGKALLEFKWNTYGRKYYFITWAIYTIFLGSFIIVSTLSDNISWFYQQIFLYIVITLGFWHLFIEFRQLLIDSPLRYLSSSWNYLDLLATISTTAVSIYWLKNGSVSTWAITFSTLFLEIKFITFFRPIKFFGNYLAIIMNTVDKVISFLVIFGFFTLAFAHSLHLLLRPTSETSQDSGINMFGQFGSAIIASYYMMITGDTEPISYWISNENIVIMILMIMVSFFVLIYLMNLFIGILSEIVSNGNHELAYLALKREIIVEIELLYMLPYQRRKENWFPFVIFYECDTIKLRDYILDIPYNKRPGDKMPNFSKNLIEGLTLPNEPSSEQNAEKIKDEVYEIKEKVHEIKKIIKGLATHENLKELIKDLPTHNDLKDLKELIEDLKTNKVE